MRTFIVNTKYKTKSDYKNGLVKIASDSVAYKYGQWAGRLIKVKDGFELEVVSDEVKIESGDTVEFYQPPRLLGQLLIIKVKL